ncbi:MAG: sn-glycerol-1-phosphate dehydrogenase [Firmicutes bacterium]|nr:sn-glycerol-1-phosphate dehydrogenase [Bacillota bacterium]
MTGFAAKLDELRKGFVCACGQRHQLPIADILIEQGIIEGIPVRLKKLGLSGPVHLVADTHTMSAAGDSLEYALNRQGMCTTKTVYATQEGDLVPDEAALGRLVLETSPSVEVLVAVGSGTITDLVRLAAYKMGRPFVSVPTAPSMDGYASAVAPLIIGGFKRTFNARPPLAIYADLDVLCQAPLEMISAGFGDLIGKFTARADWQLGHILHGEPYCEASLDLMATALEQCTARPRGLLERDPRLIQKLMEGLTLSGIAIIMAGNSRPASGSEHILAHYWEMRSLEEQAHYHLHGTKVGVATPLILRLYGQMLALDPCMIDESALMARHLNPDVTERWIREHFGARATEILVEAPGKRVQWEARKDHIMLIRSHWDEIQRALVWLPSGKAVIAMLEEAGAPAEPLAIGLPPSWVEDALLYARMLRDRYTILDVAAELGVKPHIGVE